MSLYWISPWFNVWYNAWYMPSMNLQAAGRARRMVEPPTHHDRDDRKVVNRRDTSMTGVEDRVVHWYVSSRMDVRHDVSRHPYPEIIARIFRIISSAMRRGDLVFILDLRRQPSLISGG